MRKGQAKMVLQTFRLAGTLGQGPVQIPARFPSCRVAPVDFSVHALPFPWTRRGGGHDFQPSLPSLQELCSAPWPGSRGPCTLSTVPTF